MPSGNETRPISFEAYRALRGRHSPHVRPQKGPDVYTYIGRFAQATQSAKNEAHQRVSRASGIKARLPLAQGLIDKIGADRSTPIPLTDAKADKRLGYIAQNSRKFAGKRGQRIKLTILASLLAAATVGAAIETNNAISRRSQENQQNVILDSTRSTTPAESSAPPTSESERQRLSIVDHLEHNMPDDLRKTASDYNIRYLVAYKEKARNGIVTDEGDGLATRTYPWPYVSTAIARTQPLHKKNDLVEWNYELLAIRTRLNSPKIVSVERWAINANTDPNGQPWLYKAIEINSDAYGHKVYITELGRNQPPSIIPRQRDSRDITV